jgi:hypothetical protein
MSKNTSSKILNSNRFFRRLHQIQLYYIHPPPQVIFPETLPVFTATPSNQKAIMPLFP